MYLDTEEKAEELINFYRVLLMNEDTDCGNEILCTMIAIKCDLKNVDEILESQPSYKYWETYDDETPSAFTYWEEVKQKINNYKI
jgi:hypothetical protein